MVKPRDIAGMAEEEEGTDLGHETRLFFFIYLHGSRLAVGNMAISLLLLILNKVHYR